MKLKWLGVVLVCGLLSTAAQVGSAANAAPPDAAVVEARKHFEDGTKAFNLGEFDRAIAEYKAAYNAKPDPVFLYNIAQSYRLSNDLSQALFFYRSFLRNQPNTPNRKEIEERIRQLEAQISQQKAITTSPPTTTVPPGSLPTPTPSVTTTPPVTPVHVEPAPTPGHVDPPPVTAPVAAQPNGVDLTSSQRHSDKPIYKKGWFWGVVGGVVVVAGVGVGLGVGLTRGASAPTTTLGNNKIFALQGAQ